MAAQRFALRREVVESIVERIEVQADKTTVVSFIFDMDATDDRPVDLDNSMLREFIGGSSLKDFKLWEAKS